MPSKQTPVGNTAREAIDSLRGYVYQIYQSALAWTELNKDEFLFLEVAEDFAIVAKDALNAIQVKETAGRVTINSSDIITSIDSFVELKNMNPNLTVRLRHLTTSTIGKEQKLSDRVGDKPTLDAWRDLSRSGDLSELRSVLNNSKLSTTTKSYINTLDDSRFREDFLRKIHFDCGALHSRFLVRQLNSRISKLLLQRGGLHSQAQTCMASILFFLLKLSINPNRDERFVDRNGLEELLEAATRVTLSRAQFEAQNQLMTRALSASLSNETTLSSAQLIRPSPVSETPLPKALADRAEVLRTLQKTLETSGFCWISGAAGMGKTFAARILAHNNKGDWASVNLRGKPAEGVAALLFTIADSLREFDLKGLIIDDISWLADPNVFDGFSYLIFAARRSDIFLIVNSSELPSNDLLFNNDLPVNIAFTLGEFSEYDIQEIIAKYGVTDLNWAKYTHLVSGGGHPQLAMAFIQSMAASGWDPSEFQTLDALLKGSSAIEDVRKRTRIRLLNDLPLSNRQLLERLSLKTGGFSRDLAVDLASVEPAIANAGIILETLIGSWVDQQGGNRFCLSPLLSGFATKTLSTETKKQLESAIANSLTKSRSLDLIDMNSAFLAAWSSENENALRRLCLAIITSSFSEIEMIAPHLSAFTLFRTDKIAFPSNAPLSHMFRGAQVLLINQESDSFNTIQDALRCFAKEASNVEHAEIRGLINLFIYSKLLLQTSKSGLGLNFIDVTRELDQIIESEAFSSDVFDGTRKLEEDGITAIGFMFLNQARLLGEINDLNIVFDFLDSVSADFRSRLLSPLRHDDFDVDMLVSGAWLREHEREAIDPLAHSKTFARLEEQAAKWGETDLAVCCRKYQAIILDEYGSDKDKALSVLDNGLSKYGHTNSALVRAKAKVLYRSSDHKGSLELSKKLIESDAPLSEVEKAFLGRDAAISAEKQGDFPLARRFYLYGSDAAKNSDLPDMAAMRVGLLADAALASWHAGNRAACLQSFVTVLGELRHFEPDETLRTAHCHAVVRHALLWLDQEAMGEKRILKDGKATKIYPGCVSNPEPHSAIGERYITPIDLAWYMLATVENHLAIDAGITAKLEQFLPKGPVLEGQMLLGSAKMHSALSRSDAKLFVAALKENIAYLAFAKASGSPTGGLDIKNVTYGYFPTPSKQQKDDLSDLAEKFVLSFVAVSIFNGNFFNIHGLLSDLANTHSFHVRRELLDCFLNEGPIQDFHTEFASLLLACSKGTLGLPSGSPRQVFEVAFKSLQIGQEIGKFRLVARTLRPWIKNRWERIWDQQRFLLSRPLLHEASITAALKDDQSTDEQNVVDILLAVLPTLRIGNQSQVEKILSAMR